ncbi:RNA-binding domain-containing protein [Hymenopellis radicata]|nr:RNA-binding domain-containing protein [Hymenopellis radicata]
MRSRSPVRREERPPRDFDDRNDGGRRDDRHDRDGRGRGGGGGGGGRGGGENNPGNNLHVSGLSRTVSMTSLQTHFAACGRVQKASVMLDPHTRDSRGFGFVTMETPEEADAAIQALNGTEFMGRTLVIEKARRGRARTPTPGKYYGPPKRGEVVVDEGGYGRERHRYARGGGGGRRDYGDRGDRGGGRDYGRDDRGGGGRDRDYDRGGRSGGGDRGDRKEYSGGGGRDYERRF